MRVRVYRNLNKNTLSILKKTKNGWRLMGYCNRIALINVEFIVYESGRQRVLSQKRKNVHAFIEGEIDDSIVIPPYSDEVTYNPYKGIGFSFKDSDELISNAPGCLIQNFKVYV